MHIRCRSVLLQLLLPLSVALLLIVFGAYAPFTKASAPLAVATFAHGALSVSIPVNSVSTTNAKLDGELKEKDWLDATAFPTATFKSTKVVVTGHDVVGDALDHARRLVALYGELAPAHHMERPVVATERFGDPAQGLVAGPGDHRTEVGGDVREHQFAVRHEQVGEPRPVAGIGGEGVGRRQGAQLVLDAPVRHWPAAVDPETRPNRSAKADISSWI